MIILRKSIASDVKELTSISTKAFDTDVLVGGPENDGSPGYNSEGWHREMMEQNHLYTYICEDETIVGGAVIFGRDELFVGRIFIDPKYFCRGYGIALMQDIERLFSSRMIRLDTPTWNTRTNRFYKKCGYIETGRDGENVYYEKQL